LNYVFYLEKITYDNVLDWIFATKACKTSIKAGHRLSMQQMANLVKEWFDNIEGMFVCQHGRTFFVQVEKNNIDKMFDR
jgi:DNA mismatch repair ATPase MutL